MGVGIKNSKSFVCICKHTATRIRIWRGCLAEVVYLTVSVSWPSALHCNPCPTPCSPGNVPTPTPAPLMAIPPVKTGQKLYITLRYCAFDSFMELIFFTHHHHPHPGQCPGPWPPYMHVATPTWSHTHHVGHTRIILVMVTHASCWSHTHHVGQCCGVRNQPLPDHLPQCSHHHHLVPIHAVATPTWSLTHVSLLLARHDGRPPTGCKAAAPAGHAIL